MTTDAGGGPRHRWAALQAEGVAGSQGVGVLVELMGQGVAQALGIRLVSAHSSSPARIGAEPRATTVPTATPLRSVPRKNSGW